MPTDTATQKSIRAERTRLARTFELECIRLKFAIVAVLPNFCYRVVDQRTNQEYEALILRSSFDFFEFRLNRARLPDNTLLIVGRHNAVVPVRVASLSQVYLYEPLEVPTLERSNAKRRNTEEVNLLLSKYILEFESAYDELAQMDARTRRRYDRRRETYLKAKRGRPWLAADKKQKRKKKDTG